MMLKSISIALVLAGLTGAAQAQFGYPSNNRTSNGLYGTGSNPNSHTVDPYVNRNGTYVDGHHQTNPNNTKSDNYGTKGNINPYTGQVGTRGY